MTRILVFGTFDMLHAGHEHLFREARTHGDEPHLIVSVARDKNTHRIKGRTPEKKEAERAELVGAHTLVDEVVLGSENDHVTHIISLRPDIIVLGYDQEGEYVDGLADSLRVGGLSVRIERASAFQPDIYKTSLLRDTMPE